MSKKYVSRSLLCKTLAGNRVEVLTITDCQKSAIKRKGVIFMARVHPGESNSSFVMKGILNFLTDEKNEQADLLRKNFVFMIVPMVNVDGVMYGNYRCSLSGIDLNRTWKRCDPSLFPEVSAMRKSFEQFHSEHPVVLAVDLHGHSRARRAFMYGNNYEHNPESTRLFPFVMSKMEPTNFNY